MEKNTSGIVVVFVILSLLVGFALGAVLMGEDVETINEVEVTKIVNVTVEKLVEVELPAPDMLSLAVDAFMQAVEDEEDEAGNDVDVLGSYDFDEVEVSRVYDDYTVSYDDEVTTVDFSIKLRFDEDGEASEKETYDVTVIFEEEDDTIVEVEVA